MLCFTRTWAPRAAFQLPRPALVQLGRFCKRSQLELGRSTWGRVQARSIGSQDSMLFVFLAPWWVPRATILSTRIHETNPLELSSLSSLVALSPDPKRTASKTLVCFGVDPVTS